jgi:NADPH2:quinone reductase
LVKVRAAALNRADLATARGIPHGSHGGIGAPVGIEWAGEVVETGAEVEGYRPGDRVMCSGTGGYAEYAVSDWGRVNPMPDGMGFEHAATLPVSLITLHNALFTVGRLVAGESVMVQGASSGVGLMGLQIAKLKGAKLVIGTSTNDAHRTRLPEFGADLALDTREAGFADAVLGATGGKGVDLVVDMLSGRWWRRPCEPSRSSAGWSMSGALRAQRPSLTSICMRSAGSTISGSPSVPARWRKCATSTVACAPTCGRR